MSHLPSERLAALADEPATASELAHLTGCAECSRERAAYTALAELAASDARRIGAPLTSWDSLAPALAASGVVGRGHPVLLVRAGLTRRPWLQAAAAVLLVAGGMMVGRGTAGVSVVPGLGASSAAAAHADSVPHFASIEQARAARTQAQAVYQFATAFLAQNDTSARAADSPSSMRARLAALDRARDVMGEALAAAPYDPVINGYYLTTLGQREATIRQLNTVLPASLRMTSY